MVYVLVYRRFDYYRFDDVIRASTDLDVLVAIKERSLHKELPSYMESSINYKEDHATLAEQEIPYYGVSRMINHVIVFNYFRPDISAAFKECVYASHDTAKIKNWLDQAEATRENFFKLPMLQVFWDEYDPAISDCEEQKLDHYVIIDIEDNI